MSLPIEDYALISDCRTGAMVGRDGSIDWLCFPRYDSASMFGALLGTAEQGRWLVAPSDGTAVATRSYLDSTFVLATRWVTDTGELEVLDFMPVGDHRSEVARRVRCLRGSVEVREELRVRFGYAASMPWMRQLERDGGSDLVAVAGPDAVVRRGPRLTARGQLHEATYTLTAGKSVDLTLTWFESHRPAPEPVDVEVALGATVEWWRKWAATCSHEGAYYDEVPADVQIMYGLAGERFLPERELDSLPGYQGAAPVRVGNAAFTQFQGDVIGAVMVALSQAREAGIEEDAFSWPLQQALLGFVEDHWDAEDQGIWEVRGPKRVFTHSRVMTWAALDRAVRAVREYGLPGPVHRWEALRDQVRAEIETRGFDATRNTYVQSYGSTAVDAALLQLPQVGYCRADDPRMLGTVAAIESDLLHDGLLLRYRFGESEHIDDLPPGEHPFLACSFWLVEQYARSGRLADARVLMDRLVGLANDVGLLSEEYDLTTHHHAGNTPQALSHLALVQAADWISRAEQR